MGGQGAKNNPADYRVDYSFLEAGLAKGVHSVKLGYELLEGNGVKSFQTPLATLHDFHADKGNAHYGAEWDLQATKAIAKNYLVGIKYATFNAKTAGFVDTDKFWLWAEAKF